MLQPHRDPKVQAKRREAMLNTCGIIDQVVNTKVQAELKRLDPSTWHRHHQLFEGVKSAVESGSILVRGLDLAAVPEEKRGRKMTEDSQLLRFGHLGTMAAFTKGQAEKLHLDLHDDRSRYTTLLVLGREGGDWDHTEGTGDLQLKILGLSLPLSPGDVVFFQAGVMPHMAKKLKQVDQGKRVVITLFSCERTAKYLEGLAPSA
jgi:hypothetical protein